MEAKALQDGILAKIMVQGSTVAVLAGFRIAVLEEPGDDLASLEVQ